MPGKPARPQGTGLITVTRGTKRKFSCNDEEAVGQAKVVLEMFEYALTIFLALNQDL